MQPTQSTARGIYILKKKKQLALFAQDEYNGILKKNPGKSEMTLIRFNSGRE
jgi:hypothetical protein